MSSTTGEACHHFSLAEIQSATNDFDDELVIGRGGFGKVYKGRICIEETSHVVAIKRLDSTSDQGAPEFRTEIEMLSKLRHCHLVSLIGFCDDNKEMILVYEYMPHGTLYDHLHKADTPLTWVQRLKIAIGAGRGLDYLHTGVGTQHRVIHRDVKSSNILLDENLAARISDFGLSKVGPTNQLSSYVDASVKGTFGYLDPEYFYTRKLTRKTDVFAFGVVLFELLSGKLAVDERFGEEQCSLVRWAQKCVKDRKLDQMVDYSIRGMILPKCLRRFAQIADRCLYSVPKERPTMTEVVASLQILLELQGKHNDSAESSGIMGFPWNIHKIFVSTSKQNSAFGRNHGEMPHQHGELVAKDLKKFTYDELECATRNFGNDTCLGVGRYAEVYKGWVDKTTYSPSKDNTGLPIAIKILRHDIDLDLEMLKEFSHPNLVKLLGYCLEQKRLFLVYEFMRNGNFQDCLNEGVVARLPLVTKVKIAVGIARGIVFLHETQEDGRAGPFRRGTYGMSRPDRHKTLQEENTFNLGAISLKDAQWTETISDSRLDRRKILLDEDFTVKLSDYDITKLVHSQYLLSPSYKDRKDDHEGGYYYPGFWRPFQLRTNLSGFTAIFAEVVTGREISNPGEFQLIDDVLHRCGGKPVALDVTANLCFEICNEVDSESKMLKIFKEYKKYF